MTLYEVMKKYKEDHSGSDIYAIMQSYALDSRLDRTVLNTKLFEELGMCDVWFEDPDVFKVFQDNLFDLYSYNIGKMVDTLELTYNPLQSTNITETTTINIDQNLDTDTTSSSENEYTRTRSDSDTSTSRVSAFDESTFQDESQRVGSGSESISHDESKSSEGNKSEDLEWRETDTTTRSGYEDKDVQSAIEKERRLALFNVYEWIVKKYKEDLIIMVY